VVLVEYGDYECPYLPPSACSVNALGEYMGDELKFVFRHFLLTTYIHTHSRPQRPQALRAVLGDA
jgi:hypothetical protein